MRISIRDRRSILQMMTSGVLTTAAVLAALLTIAARAVQAQTETVLYSFCSQPNCTDGAQPNSSLTFDGAGNLYGTTWDGGLGSGTVFELSPSDGGGWNQIVLYAFTGGVDGGVPEFSPVIFDGVGNLYGTAFLGGAYNEGVVFELSSTGETWTETVPYSFPGGADSAGPITGLTVDPAGNLYGATNDSPNSPTSVVYELSPSRTGWTEQALYNESPPGSAGPTLDTAGNIFCGTFSAVVELSPNGDGGWTPTVLHTFPGKPKDGSGPLFTPVLDNAGNVYDTTFGGGAKGYGTVFKLTPITRAKNKKVDWQQKILHSFKGGKKDGSGPWAGIVLDASGNIYGTTTDGGQYGLGTVFELVAPVGEGPYTEKILWSFNGTDGADPLGDLILDSAGNLYGTTFRGGSSGAGVVFEVTP